MPIRSPHRSTDAASVFPKGNIFIPSLSKSSGRPASARQSGGKALAEDIPQACSNAAWARESAIRVIK